MPDYKSMYYRLFNRVSDAITLLQAAQQEGEDTFANSSDGTITEIIEQAKKDINLK